MEEKRFAIECKENPLDDLDVTIEKTGCVVLIQQNATASLREDDNDCIYLHPDQARQLVAALAPDLATERDALRAVYEAASQAKASILSYRRTFVSHGPNSERHEHALMNQTKDLQKMFDALSAYEAALGK